MNMKTLLYADELAAANIKRNKHFEIFREIKNELWNQ